MNRGKTVTNKILLDKIYIDIKNKIETIFKKAFYFMSLAIETII